jgi:hypothetical protein
MPYQLKLEHDLIAFFIHSYIHEYKKRKRKGAAWDQEIMVPERARL